jgi:hypothetical protein
MKTIFFIGLLSVFLAIQGSSLRAQDDELSPYYLVGHTAGSMDEAAQAVTNALTDKGFTVIGTYNPAASKSLRVIAYTRKDLQTITLKVEDKGALASVLKIGLKMNDGKIAVSMLNPTYLYYAYLRGETAKHLTGLQAVADDAKKAMETIGKEFTAFGGSEEIDDLKDYHYMAFMPYFDDPVELNTFSTFEEGLNKIRKNLEAKKGSTLKVYELVLKEEKIAIFGVGLMDSEKGEGNFLPIIGEDNLAAMPYEIILTDTEATMLHGKFRIALHWPELSMGQFMKISSTPGDIEDFLKALTE